MDIMVSNPPEGLNPAQLILINLVKHLEKPNCNNHPLKDSTCTGFRCPFFVSERFGCTCGKAVTIGRDRYIIN